MDAEKSTVEVRKQEAGRTPESERMRTGNVYLPNVDISEDKDAIIIVADMPGVGEQDVSVTLENDVLTIEGKVDAGERGEYTRTYTEYGVGDYSRSFIINEAIERDRIEASVKDGVLRIVLPRAEATKPRHIPIRSA